ncbi:hypothetical protein ALP39_200375 [Pseudomonas marginalis pv. marginalis]|nr:hypothetical protein ALP39_200375 [Pseudomonas marginalis pv. marginalis]
MKESLIQSMKEKIMQPAFESKAPVAARMSDPLVDTPMVLTLDETLPYDENPRTTRNPKYDEIKDSIRQRGLDAPPPVTRKPGEEKFRIRNGGNTRLAILNELYQETGEERFFKFHCLFRPWDAARGEIISLTGHLAENDLQGELLFIERAMGVERAKTLYEAESQESISLRELSRRLAADGYPVSASHLSRMQETIRHLLPSVPGLLYSGLGTDRIIKLLALRKSALLCWERNTQDNDKSLSFERIFQDVLTQFEGDAEEFLFPRFQDELIHQLKTPLDLGYEKILFDITQNQDQLRRTTPVIETPAPMLDSTASKQAEKQHSSDDPVNSLEPEKQNHSGQPIHAPPALLPLPTSQMSAEEVQLRLEGHVVTPVSTTAKVLQIKQRLAAIDGEELPDFNTNALVSIPVQAGGLHPISDLWYIEREIDTPELLRIHIAQLAREILNSVNAPGEAQSVKGGIGFAYSHADDEAEMSVTAQHTVTLLHSLSGSVAIALTAITQQPELQIDALADFEFAAGLGQLLLGQPLAKDQPPSHSGRLSDEALVKLFRVIRLSRRLIDLEITALQDPAYKIDN